MDQQLANGEHASSQVLLDVSGLSEVFPSGIREGSIVLVAGPPGSGKTILTLQLLMQLHRKGQAPEPAKTLFISCDEHESDLKHLAATILPVPLKCIPGEHGGPKILPLMSQLSDVIRESLHSGSDRATNEQTRRVMKQILDVSQMSEDYLSRMRRLAAEMVANTIIKAIRPNVDETASDGATPATNGSCNAIAVDGVLNLPECRGATAEEQRDAMRTVCHHLRSEMRRIPWDGHRPVAFLTWETTVEPYPPDAAEYLVDAVIKLSPATTAHGCLRQGRLHVTKCRYGPAVPGPHTFHIMGDDDVNHRKESAGELGWSPSTVDCIQKGVVVFPRYRWPSQRHPASTDEQLRRAAADAQKVLKHIDGDHLNALEIAKNDLGAFISNRLRRLPLDQSDSDVLDRLDDGIDLLQGSQDLITTVPPEAGSATEVLTALVNAVHAHDEQTRAQPVVASFGVPGLDQLFGHAGGARDQAGVTARTSTMLLGAPGTGKTSLALSFLLAGYRAGDDVIYLSFDERHRRILQQYGNLVVSENGRLSPTLGDIVGEQLEQRMAGDTAKAVIRLIYESPVNVDLNALMHMLQTESIRSRFAAGRHTRPLRIIVDSLTDIERSLVSPAEFEEFVSVFLNNSYDWEATSLLVYEGTAHTEPFANDRALSHMADNVVLLHHVPVNNMTRKCVSVLKARGRSHDASPIELVYEQVSPKALQLSAKKGFEGMSKILTHQPVPVRIELRLFHENSLEAHSNEELVKAVQRRFGRERVQYVPYTLADAQRAYWHREAGRDLNPAADVTVMSMDEPWVQVFARSRTKGRQLLSEWEPTAADVHQREDVLAISWRTRSYAARRHTHSILPPLVAIPHYWDRGLFLCRRDLLGQEGRPPTLWEANGDTEGSSVEEIASAVSKKHNVPGLAFNMASPETTACVFLEMCWSMHARPDFLVSGDETDRAIVTRVLLLLARLRWQGVLPYPCSLEHCAESALCRVWYANLPRMHEYMPEGAWCPVPVPSGGPLPPGDPQRNILAELLTRKQLFLEERLRHLDDRLPKTRANFNDRRAIATAIDEVKVELNSLRNELESLQDGGRQQVGYVCSGTWYLAVLSTGGNAGVGWSIVHDAVSREAVRKRALSGTSLPAAIGFYRDYGDHSVPGLEQVKFGELLSNHLGIVRNRSMAVGFGEEGFKDQHEIVRQVLSELPELLHSLVTGVLGDPRSDMQQNNSAKEYVRAEADVLFDDIDRRLTRHHDV